MGFQAIILEWLYSEELNMLDRDKQEASKALLVTRIYGSAREFVVSKNPKRVAPG